MNGSKRRGAGLRLTPEGRIAAATAPVLGAVGLWLAVPVLVGLGLVLVGALLVGLVVVSRRPHLEVERDLSRRRGVVGDQVRADLVITNRGAKASPTAVVHEPVGTQMWAVEVPTIAAGDHHRASYALPTDRRGIHTLGPARVRRDDAFGLVTWSQELSGTDRFWVHPRTLLLPPLPSGRRRDLEGPASNRAMQGTAQFHALREFVRGDDRRHIHWRSSLRTGTLMVAEHVDVTRPKATVVLDVQRDHWDVDGFERGVSIVASILVSTIDRGFPVRLLATDGTTYDQEQRPDANLVLDACSGLELVDHAPLGMAATWLARDRSGSTLTIVTGSSDPMVIAPLRPLASRYDEVVVIRVVGADDTAGGGAGSGPVGVLVVHDVRDVRSAWLRGGRR